MGITTFEEIVAGSATPRQLETNQSKPMTMSGLLDTQLPPMTTTGVTMKATPQHATCQTPDIANLTNPQPAHASYLKPINVLPLYCKSVVHNSNGSVELYGVNEDSLLSALVWLVQRGELATTKLEAVVNGERAKAEGILAECEVQI